MSNTRKTENKTETDAAIIMQKYYRKYQENKEVLLEKKGLISQQQKTISADGEMLPVPLTEEDEKKEIFSNASIDLPVFFKSHGMRTLFPGKQKINLQLLEHYLNKDKQTDIRQWTLEAYFRNLVDKNALITLFAMQGAMNEYKKTSKSQNKQLRIYSIYTTNSGEKKFTAESEILTNYLKERAPHYALHEKTRSQFFQKLEDNLKTIPEHANYFSYVEYSLDEMYRLTLDFINQRQLFINEESELLNKPFFQKFIVWILESLKIENINPINFDFKTCTPTIFAEIVKKLGEKLNISVSLDTLVEYIKDKIKLSNLFSNTTLKYNAEFLPVIYFDKENNKETAILILLGSHVHDAWCGAAANLDREKVQEIAPKHVKIGKTSLLEKNRASLGYQGLIGLDYPGIPISNTAHGVPPGAWGYQAHDERFHWTCFANYRMLAAPIFEVQIRFAEIIKETTGHQACFGLNQILDLSEVFFYSTSFSKGKDSNDLRLLLPLENSNGCSPPHFFEYTCIIISDLLKKNDFYQEKFKEYAEKKDNEFKPITFSFLLNQMTSHNTDLTFTDLKKTDVQKRIKEYSHSLGVFFILCIGYQIADYNELLTLCEKLNSLENNRIIKFKWNKYEGMILEMEDDLSFRFRKINTSNNPGLNDPRYKSYPDDQKIRKFCDEKDWFYILKNIVESEYSTKIQRSPNTP